MRADSFRSRLERLEASRCDAGAPNLVLSSCPMPDAAPAAGAVAQWLDDGLAHVAFNGRAVFYDGGEIQMDQEQWRLRYCKGLPS